MNREPLLLYGASGHAKVILDIIERAGQYRIIGLLDDNPSLHGTEFFGYPVLGEGELLAQRRYRAHKLIISVGDNRVRQEIRQRISAFGAYDFALALHPSAQIAKRVRLGAGTVVMANVAINPDASVGQHVIINTGATVDHDCLIGDFVHIGPGAHLAGNVAVGALTHLGIGVTVIPGVKIGSESVIGAGAVVLYDIPDRVTAVGVPARVIKPHPGER
jgi:sugar O-acyltransferase (sialic acid O-acetyltransferase NeuD family)